MNSLAFLFVVHGLYLLTRAFAEAADPYFSSGLYTNVTVVAGREARLACPVENLQHYKVAWIHYGSTRSTVLSVDTQVLTINKRVSILVERDTWFLIIGNASVKDRGKYMCQVNTVPPKVMYTTLHVLVPPDISLTPKDVNVNEGSNATLQCDATGDPTPTITWKREDNRNLPREGRKEWIGRNFTLYNVTKGNAGAFLCIASNGVPPAVSARAEVFVRYSPVMSQWEVDTHRVVINTTAMLNCTFQAFPRPTVTWSRYEDSSENPEFEVRTEFFPEGRGTSRLVFPRVSNAIFGSYKCLVENDIGSAQQIFHLLEYVVTTTRPWEKRLPSFSETSTVLSTTSATLFQNSIFSFSKNISLERIIQRYLGNQSLTIADSPPRIYNHPGKKGGAINRPGIEGGAPSADRRDNMIEDEYLNPKAGDTTPPKRFRQESTVDTNKLRPFPSDYSNEGLSSTSCSSLRYYSLTIIITVLLSTCALISETVSTLSQI